LELLVAKIVSLDSFCGASYRPSWASRLLLRGGIDFCCSCCIVLKNRSPSYTIVVFRVRQLLNINNVDLQFFVLWPAVPAAADQIFQLTLSLVPNTTRATTRAVFRLIRVR